MESAHVQLVSPTKQKRTVILRRPPNHELRPREHLTEREVEKLIEAAKKNRHGQRDAAIILICFRHGLRASELCELQWSDVEFETATLHLRRAKKGATGTHPLLGDELRALRALKREAKSPFMFVSERGAPFTVSGLQKLVERPGVAAKIPFKVHPHMLRHATGYVLANKGTDTRTLQSYLGHRSIQSTVRYTELAPVVSKIFGGKLLACPLYPNSGHRNSTARCLLCAKSGRRRNQISAIDSSARRAQRGATDRSQLCKAGEAPRQERRDLDSCD